MLKNCYENRIYIIYKDIMLHDFVWSVKTVGKDIFLVNSSFWIQVMYSWEKKEWEFFVYPYFDDQRKTFWYFAFDGSDQKEMFEMMLKVSWVWPKTAFQIVQLPLSELKDAVENLDAKFFQSIPGIGPKMAKKIVLELKDNVQIFEAIQVDQDQKLFKSVTKSLQNFWFESSRVKELLRNYPEKLTEENLPNVVKWVISEMWK